MKGALTYQKLSDKKVRCAICQRRCTIADGRTGFCRNKINQKGILYTTNYGLITSLQIDPIEKKPFYHFHPGSSVASLGSWGCNFRCKQCLNYWCSYSPQKPDLISISPENLIQEVKKTGHPGIAFTYNEPVIWAEYVLDVAKLAKKAGLYTVFVTNGSWTKETLDKIGPYIDAANIDFKGFSEATYQKQSAFFGQIPEMAKYAQQKHKFHLEITVLLIPGINDNPKELEKMAQWIAKNLGPKTPLHFSQFDPEAAPDKDFQKIPSTSIEQLEKAAGIAKKAGLKFIYIWAPRDNYSRGDLICPKCHTVCIKRTAWQPELLAADKKSMSAGRQGHCTNCGENLNVTLL
jgi:pyruvate formate lyase activating enzyme